MRTLSASETLMVGGGKSQRRREMELSCKSDINTGFFGGGGTGATVGSLAGGAVAGPGGALFGGVVLGGVGALSGMLTAIGNNRDCREIFGLDKGGKDGTSNSRGSSRVDREGPR